MRTTNKRKKNPETVRILSELKQAVGVRSDKDLAAWLDVPRLHFQKQKFMICLNSLKLLR